MSNPELIREFVRYSIRGDTHAELVDRNEVLLERELCLEVDTGRIKMGDATTHYNDLPYIPIGDYTNLPVDIRRTATHVQWRPHEYAQWEDLFSLEEMEGDPGRPGSNAYIEMRTTESHVQYRRQETGGWTNLISIANLQGPVGPAAVELGRSDTHVQWRERGETDWEDLVAIQDLRGTDGRELELRVTSTHLQYRLGDSNWMNALALSSIRGEDGEDGKNVQFDRSGQWLRYRLEGETTWTNIVQLSEIQGPVGEGSHTTMGATFSIFDMNEGSALSIPVRTNCAGEIVSMTILTPPGQSGSALFDIRKCPGHLYPAGLQSICGTNRPQLSGASYRDDSELEGWTTTFAKGDVFVFTVNSVVSIQNVTIQLGVIKENG